MTRSPLVQDGRARLQREKVSVDMVHSSASHERLVKIRPNGEDTMENGVFWDVRPCGSYNSHTA
jgi:hypothetical protein